MSSLQIILAQLGIANIMKCKIKELLVFFSLWQESWNIQTSDNSLCTNSVRFPRCSSYVGDKVPTTSFVPPHLVSYIHPRVSNSSLGPLSSLMFQGTNKLSWTGLIMLWNCIFFSNVGSMTCHLNVNALVDFAFSPPPFLISLFLSIPLLRALLDLSTITHQPPLYPFFFFLPKEF